VYLSVQPKVIVMSKNDKHNPVKNITEGFNLSNCQSC